MKQNYLHDQRGVAMLLELVLVAAVLGLVGVAVYQSSHHGTTASITSKPTAVTSAASLADSAAVITETNANSDATLSASAESSAAAVSDADIDATNLGGSSSANSY